MHSMTDVELRGGSAVHADVDRVLSPPRLWRKAVGFQLRRCSECSSPCASRQRIRNSGKRNHERSIERIESSGMQCSRSLKVVKIENGGHVETKRWSLVTTRRRQLC